MTSATDPVLRLHHFAWRCRDAEETRAFYEDILGMPLAHIVRADTVPSTGEQYPYVHLFFKMQDNSFIAFFDLGDNVKALPSPNTPAWVNHFAMKVASLEALERFKARLEQAGIEVLGVTDHGSMKSIYFFDPNGIRLEFTVDQVSDEVSQSDIDQAHVQLEAWIAEKAQRREAAPH
ncbi:VOC family protein [Pusillimonas sp.]|uniref:VOC family protein n=1 Tax=Pusillimonas sp. TaxID=3040095 RepID=UPI0029A9B112|nr:VOC family protein [Pusillimonas sp.]MDX3894215.1 VOC family protein [Pusillimonas sp.]